MIQLAADVAAAPAMGIPKQTQGGKDMKAAYRFLSNDRIDAAEIVQPQCEATRAVCRGRGTVLCVQDSSELDFKKHQSTKGLGLLGEDGRGLLQHSTLAVTTDGEVLGVLDLQWVMREELHTHETRTELANRWRESLLWGESMERIGAPPQDCRYVLVADRAADCFETMQAMRCSGRGVCTAGKAGPPRGRRD